MDYRTSRIIPVILTIAIVAVIILVSVPIFQSFFGPSRVSNPTQLDADRSALTSTTAGRSVGMFVRGNLVADENFRAYQIKITPNSREITGYKGYERQVIKNESLTNNIPAYEQFVYALNRAHFMDGVALSGEANDTRGVCATGNLYEFETLNDNKTVKMLWTTNCSGQRGSFNADLDGTINLFQSQIPNAESFIDSVWQ